jgi:RNA polymerase sigma-70 factor (ECF subfamily)
MFTSLTVQSKQQGGTKKPIRPTGTVPAGMTEGALLIHRVALKQADALSELYDRYGRLVFSIAFNSVGDQATAEEIVQDVFTRVWNKANTYDASISSLSTWLIRITRNRAIDELRKHKTHPERYPIGWSEVSLSERPTSPGPEEETELSLRQKFVRDALETLPANEKDLLALAYFKGYSQSKIADLLGIPLGTVKTRVRKAMQTLRLVLSEAILEDQ